MQVNYLLLTAILMAKVSKMIKCADFLMQKLSIMAIRASISY